MTPTKNESLPEPIRIQIGREFKDLPNEEGFAFRGIDHDGDLHPCIVMKDFRGCHYVAFEEDGRPCMYYLRGWLPYRNKEDEQRYRHDELAKRRANQ